MFVQKMELKEISFSIDPDQKGEPKIFLQIRNNSNMPYNSYEIFMKNHEDGKSFSVVLNEDAITKIIGGLAAYFNIL